MYSQCQLMELLASHGIRPSVQRIAILDFMFKSHSHPTADEIYSALSAEMPTLSKTTVYNVLKSFIDAGVAFALNIDDKNARYDATLCDHAHLKCERCERVFDLPLSGTFERVVNGFVINKVHTYYWGVCPECQLEHNSNQKEEK